MQSWHSILWQYFRHSGLGDIKQQCPIIQDNIKKWMKTYFVTKSSFLSAEDVAEFLSLIDKQQITPELLQLLIVPTTAIPYAARGCESMKV